MVRSSQRMSLVTLKDSAGNPIQVDGDDKFIVYDRRCVETLISVISALTGKTFIGSGQSDHIWTLRAV
jgi:hypothetical protein